MFNRHKKRVKSVNLTDFFSEELKNNAEKVLKQRISSLKAELGKENSSELSESEIMKGLECHKEREIDTCSDCPYFNIDGCAYELCGGALDLINRKNAEIERLEESRAEWKEAALRKANELDKSRNELSYLKFDLMCGTSKAQAEVIQLFVGRLKARSRKMQSSDWSGEFWDKAVLVTDIDQIAKEMGVEL